MNETGIGAEIKIEQNRRKRDTPHRRLVDCFARERFEEVSLDDAAPSDEVAIESTMSCIPARTESRSR